MIAMIAGEVLIRRPDHVIVDVGGVGYRLAVSTETLRSVPAVGKKVSLHAHLIPRDDALVLYGFAAEEERDLFLMLISISGIGPKVALAALSGGSPAELLRAIASGDAKRFQAVPGIGKRTAERIIVELRERVAEQIGEQAAPVDAVAGGPREEAREGLIGLGYSAPEAERLLDGADGETPEDLIAAALRGGRAAA